MTGKADPRVLDKNKTVEDTSEQTYITYHEPIIEDGVQTYKVHGPIPSEEWAEYEREHGL